MPVPELDPEVEFRAAAAFAELRAKSPAGFACEHCGADRYEHTVDRPRVFVCLRCRKPRWVTAGTLLHRSHVGLSEWVIAAEFVEKRRSARALAKELNRRYETAWRMMQRIRQAFPVPEAGPPTADCARARVPEDPPLRKPRFFAQRAHFLVVPVAGRHVCVPTDYDTWAQHNGPSGAALVWTLREHIRAVHRQVSMRWYPAYFRQHEALQHRRALPDLLAGARRPWRALVLPPPWVTGLPEPD